MTYEEAKIRSIQMLKIDIRNRLHKYNPNKYPKVILYTPTEACEVAMALVFDNPKRKNPFESDDFFYIKIKRK